MEAPKHVGIILDGNRRYAKRLGLKPWKGHEEGAKRLKEVILKSMGLGIRNLTLYIFSTENFNRSKIEVEFLMLLFRRGFKEVEKQEEIMENVRIHFAGQLALFSDDMQERMAALEKKTEKNTRMTLNMAMAYGGRDEIVNTVRKIIDKNIPSKDITEETIKENLFISEDADLIIRTSGEKRLSGFLPWQGTYAELIFVDKMWPEFTENDLVACVEEFNSRKRRFGR